MPRTQLSRGKDSRPRCWDAETPSPQRSPGRGLRVDKPENGRVAEGRALLAQTHLKAVAWPFWASYATLGAGRAVGGGRGGRSAGEWVWQAGPRRFSISWLNAMMGLRDLEALSWADEKGRELAAAHDGRSRSLGCRHGRCA
jgi:hypothetical protein